MVCALRRYGVTDSGLNLPHDLTVRQRYLISCELFLGHILTMRHLGFDIHDGRIGQNG
jgi:hypothetical protein